MAVKERSGRRTVPQLLIDMRWAYRHRSDDVEGSPNQQLFRDQLKDKPKEFLDRLERLEKEFAKGGPERPTVKKPAQAEGASQQPPAEDAGEARCVELVERLLAEASWRPGAAPHGS